MVKNNGQVSEWFKEVVLKTTDGVSYPGVRIPPCPDLKSKITKYKPI